MKESIKRLLKDMLKHSPFGSSVFYAIASKAFWREHYSVMKGIEQYGLDNSAVCLRRNIHRLEKGLCMKERRDVFALEYIKETVDCYEKELAHNAGKTEVKWAHDVLTAYFDAVQAHEIIDPERKRFNDLEKVDAKTQESAPFTVKTKGNTVRYEDLLELARGRKSVRFFQKKPVPRELVDKAVTAASYSPSACNRQPFEFRIIDDPELLKKVSSIPMGTVGYAENIPMIAIITGKQNSFFDERDRHLIYIDGSLAAMSFVFALESLGLSSCCINWPDIENRNRRIVDALELADYETPVMLIAIGYADPESKVPFSQKKPLEDLRRYNSE